MIDRAGDLASPEAAEALAEVCSRYWAPMYAFLRRRDIATHDARDYVQGFLSKLIEKEFLRQVDHQRGRFRTFLRAALWHFVLNEIRDRKTERRGGGKVHIPIEAFHEAEENLPRLGMGETADTVYDRDWAEGLMRRGHAALASEYTAAGRRAEFEELNPWLTKPGSTGDYDELARKRGVTPNAIAAAVKRLRGEFLDHLRAQVLPTVESPSDVEAELKYLLDVLLADPVPKGARDGTGG